MKTGRLKFYTHLVFAFTALASIPVLGGCTPVGMAAGAGAAVGVGAAREGGLKGTASDIRIEALISDKWFKYNLSAYAKLNVTVNQGRVLITGIVQEPEHRVEAIRLAWQVEGVNQVINEIRVAESEGLSGYVKDQWITTKLRTALTFDKDVQSINYTIDTVNGTVYLMGVAQHQAELNRAIEIARNTKNVRQVVSYVKFSGEGQDNKVMSSEQGATLAPDTSEEQSSVSSSANAGGAIEPVQEEIIWNE